jgi:hypothetical protein
MNRAIIEIIEENITVDIGTVGPQGPAGTIDYGELGYVHDQMSASTTWLVEHGLNFIPNITVVDSAGTVIEGSYSYPNSSTVILNFSNSFAGKAYLS